jgi:hypothetical protein
MDAPPPLITKSEFALYWRGFKEHLTAWIGGIIATMLSLVVNLPGWLVWPWFGFGLIATGFLVWRDEYRKHRTTVDTKNATIADLEADIMKPEMRVEKAFVEVHREAGSLDYTFVFSNVGKHAATNLWVKMFFRRTDFGEPPISSVIEFYGTLPKGRKATVSQNVIIHVVPPPKAFISLYISFDDKVTGKHCEQEASYWLWLPLERNDLVGVPMVAIPHIVEQDAPLLKLPLARLDVAPQVGNEDWFQAGQWVIMQPAQAPNTEAKQSPPTSSG